MINHYNWYCKCWSCAVLVKWCIYKWLIYSEKRKIKHELLRCRASKCLSLSSFPPVQWQLFSFERYRDILVLISWISRPTVLRKKRVCYHDMPCKIMYSALKSSKMTAFYCNGEKYLYVQQIYFLWRFYVGLFDGICVGVSHKCAFEQ